MDSLSVDFYIKTHIPHAILATLPVINNIRRDADEIKSEYLVGDKGISPLKNAGFKVKAIKVKDGEHPLDFYGYQVSLNIPACTTGNNIMLVNDWHHSHQIALMMFHYWLLKKGCHPDAIHAFDLENAETNKATPTFLVPFDNPEAAASAKKALFDHAEAIHNYRLRTKQLAEDLVYMKGSSRNFTWYIEKKKDYLLRFYNKTGRIKDAFYNFGEDQILAAQAEASLFALGANHLRIEGDFTKAWLSKHGFHKPLAVENETLLFETMWSAIRKALWADFEFRQRAFKQKDLPKAGTTDRKLIEHYLSGGDVRQHPLVQNSYHAEKYFYEVNRRARKDHYVDYRIPWAIRKTMMCKDARIYLNTELPYKPPIGLAEHMYGPHTAPALIEGLRFYIDKELKASKKFYKTKGHAQTKNSHAAPKRQLDLDDVETSDISNLMG